MVAVRILRLLLPLLAGGAAFLRAPACGPDFPNAYLITPAAELTGLPTLTFSAELARLLPPGALAEAPPRNGAPAESPEAAEVRGLLVAAGISGGQVVPILAAYTRDNPPTALPAEFHLYARGARAWHAKKTDEAIAAWRELLALPAEARHYRTVWAAYMIGRALEEADGAAAGAAFQAARTAEKNGFADCENLASASLGREARVHFLREEYEPALRLYFQQLASGDPTAVPSLQLTLQKLFAEEAKETPLPPGAVARTPRPDPDSVLRRLAADQQLRGVVTAWFGARGGPFAPWSDGATRQFRRWLAALPATEALPPEEADRWAWAAYQNGLWTEATALARRAAPDAPASEWVRAMLLLRAGDVDEAADHLAVAARRFPSDPALNTDDGQGGWLGRSREDAPAAQLAGVRGVLALQREQFVESLRLFLTAGHWTDAAYLAERVLTLDELAGFVTAEVPAPTDTDPGPPRGGAPNQELRHLLARRLVRAGRFDRAREFFPPGFLHVYDRYVGAVRTGYRETLPAPARAQALWQAARTVRQFGLEIQGTELEPDYAVWGGNFEWPAVDRRRGTDGAPESGRADNDRVRWNPVATSTETARLAQAHLPTRRLHYRQRAAELAFLAATLLPDNNDQTALILNTAGRWVAARYPDDAELFYKTLVFRCPQTGLGQQAASLHWLVPTTESDEQSGDAVPKP